MAEGKELYIPGIPGTRDLVAPIAKSFTETTATDKTAWERIWVEKMAVLRPIRTQGPHELQYTFTAPDDQTYDLGRFYTAESGLCLLRARGPWWVRCPGTASAVIKCVILDGQSDALMPFLAAGEDPNAWTGKFEPRVMLTPAVNADVDTASEALVAARAGRRFLYIQNTSTGGQSIALAFGTDAAVITSGIIMAPGEAVSFDALDGITEQAVNVIASANNATVSYQEGT